MSVLLGVLPYLASALGYWTVYQGLFHDSTDTAPNHWQWRLVSPLFVVSLTPLVLSGTRTGADNVVLLVCSACVGLLIVFALMTVLTLREANENGSSRGRFFFSLRRLVVFGGWTVTGLTWAKVLFLGGLVVIFGFGGLSIWIAAQSPPP